MTFLVDNQLPAALARFLSFRGVDCRHVLDVGLAESTDKEIWEYAVQNGSVVISKDEDFLHLAQNSSTKGRLVWVRFGNCRKRALFEAFERLWPKIEALLEAGELVVELR